MPAQAEIAQRIDAVEENSDLIISNFIRITAAAIVEQSTKVNEKDNVLIIFDPLGMPLVKEMKSKCLGKGASVNYFMRDMEKDAQIIPALDEEGIYHYFDEEERLVKKASVILIIRALENPEIMNQVPENKMGLYRKRYSEVHDRRKKGLVRWNAFLWPTQYEAAKEKLPYEEYFKAYTEACNQHWESIKKAQEKLKKKLDKGKYLRFIANEGDKDPRKHTNLVMSIEGMTFVNSTIMRNYPGSEVFSAPVLDSVNGQIYAEGEYIYDGKLMKNIFLRVENGIIVEAVAEEGNEELQEILSRGDGARKFGEVGIGTNPGLIRRFFNDLLNEKVSGSFHMAIGHCYEYDEYDGEPVRVNNGNTSDKTPNHWDLTILMHKKPDGTGGGKIILDGEVIQEDGFFQDNDLKVLNPKVN